MIKAIENIKCEWSRELNVEFICDYQKLKVIWDPSMRHLKSDRVQAVRTLCEKYKLSADDVRGRIKVLRTSFHREHMKVLKSANSDETYVPKWYGYEMMRFIVDDIAKDHLKKNKNEIDDSFHISDATIFDINFLNYEQLKHKEEQEEHNNVINYNEENDMPDSIEVLNTNNNTKQNNFITPGQCDTIQTNLVKNAPVQPEEITIRCDNILFNNSKDSVDLNKERIDISINPSTTQQVDSVSTIEKPPPCKRTKYCIPNIWDKNYSSHSFCHCHCNTNKNEKDEFIVFGENVAVTLKNLKNSKSKIIAKHMINNILFEAQMGKYDQ